MMMPFNSHHDYGLVLKCPHCERTNIPRKTPNQLTCASARCQVKQNMLRHYINLEKAKRKAVRQTQ